MKMPIVFLFLIIMPAWLYSQLQDSSYTFAYYDTNPNLDKKEETFNRVFLSCVYTNKKNNKTVAKFNRFNDSMYVFKAYDTSGEITRSGTIWHFEDSTIIIQDTVQMPDLLNDIDGSKGMYWDTIFKMPATMYRKHGEWNEPEGSKIWSGKYYNGAKTGMWARDSHQHGHVPRDIRDSIITYENGIAVTPKFLEKYIHDKIAGKWYLHWVLSSRYYLTYTRGLSSYQHYSYDFKNNNIGKAFVNQEEKQFKWQASGNLLTIDGRNYEIILLNNDEMILKTQF